MTETEGYTTVRVNRDFVRNNSKSVEKNDIRNTVVQRARRFRATYIVITPARFNFRIRV